MLEKEEELRNKFNKQPKAPPPPPRKKMRGGADIVAKLIADEKTNPPKEEGVVETIDKKEDGQLKPETEAKTVDNSDRTDGTDGTALFSAQLHIPLDNDSHSKVQTVHTDHTDHTVQTMFQKPRRKARPKDSDELIKKTFKFKPTEAKKLEDMAYYHRMSMTDLVRMGLMMAYVELEAIEKSSKMGEQAE